MAETDLHAGLSDKVGRLYQALTDPARAGDVSDFERLEGLKELLESGRLGTMVPLLPLALNLSGKPYVLDDHFPFEPFFSRCLPDEVTVQAGRQVAKTTTLAARGLLLSAALPHFSTLYVTPLYEQIRRFSTQYVRGFIEESPLRHLWVGTQTEQSVLLRSFVNFAKMYFSFAGLSANRIRSISSDMVVIDEAQNFLPDHRAVVQETMSHARFGTGMLVYAGTALTQDCYLHKQWLRSSQAEWAMVCPRCQKVNIPSLAEDLEKMIGPYHEDIGPVRAGKKPGLICARCSHFLDPRGGRWRHMFPERRYNHPGYHVPQMIMPHHCEEPKRWAKLLRKRQGWGNYTTAKFWNEVGGESYDFGSKVISETELRRAAVLPWNNDPRNLQIQAARRYDYIARALGVDWGGGGEAEVSFTKGAIVGLRADGSLDVIAGEGLLTPHSPLQEAERLLRLYNAFDCGSLAHDYNGAGTLRETFMVHAGLDLGRIMPMVYHRTAHKDIMVFHKPEYEHHRHYWIVDKARALQLVCELIKLQHIRFFQWDYHDEDDTGLLCDFLALVESKTETMRAGEIYNITRSAAASDDFAHAVTFACLALWFQNQTWPNIALLANLRLSAEQLEAVGPDRPWMGNN
jgi:hypothetical protein